MHTLTEKIRFIESVFGGGKLSRDGRNFDVRCPMCAEADPSMPRDKKKLSIRVEDDAAHCWICGWRGKSIWILVRKIGTREQLVEYRDKYMSEAAKAARASWAEPETSVESTILALPNGFRLLALATRADPDALMLKRYCFSRGLTERDMWYFKLGASDDNRWKGRVVVPSFDSEGKLNYFVARAVDPRRRPKYDTPDVSVGHKRSVIFNEINIDWTKRLVLCEGTFDLMKCPDNAVPLLGSNLNEDTALFNCIVANKTPVALALDADMWSKKTPRLAQKLAGYDVDVTIVDTRSIGDPGGSTKDAFAELVTTASPFEWHGSFMSKLQNASNVSMRV